LTATQGPHKMEGYFRTSQAEPFCGFFEAETTNAFAEDKNSS